MTETAWRFLEGGVRNRLRPGELGGLVAALWADPGQAARELTDGWLAVLAADGDETRREALLATGRGYEAAGLPLTAIRGVLSGGLEEIGRPAVDYLARRFAGSADRAEQAWVAHLLGRFGEAAAPASSVLAATVADPADREERNDLRCQAAVALGQIDTASAEVVGALAKVAGDRDEPQPLRSYCLEALMDLGPAAAEAVPVLERVLRDETEDEDLRHFAWSALKSVGAPAATTRAAARWPSTCGRSTGPSGRGSNPAARPRCRADRRSE